MTAAVDNLALLFTLSLVVLAITMTVTKSKLFACKREFVRKRYKAAKVDGASFVHYFWHAMWTCPLCFGFWVSLAVCFWFRDHLLFGYLPSVLAVYALNWVMNVIEDTVAKVGKHFRTIKKS